MSSALISVQTFGMKNKNKSSKVQKYVQTVQKQQEQAGKNKEVVSARIWPKGLWPTGSV
jgi:hypothetical protein